MTCQISLQDFYDKLAKLDWQADFSDDFSVWKQFQKDSHELLHEAVLNGPSHCLLFQRFNAAKVSGVIPERPSNFIEPQIASGYSVDAAGHYKDEE